MKRQTKWIIISVSVVLVIAILAGILFLLVPYLKYGTKIVELDKYTLYRKNGKYLMKLNYPIAAYYDAVFIEQTWPTYQSLDELVAGLKKGEFHYHFYDQLHWFYDDSDCIVHLPRLYEPSHPDSGNIVCHYVDFMGGYYKHSFSIDGMRCLARFHTKLTFYRRNDDRELSDGCRYHKVCDCQTGTDPATRGNIYPNGDGGKLIRYHRQLADRNMYVTEYYGQDENVPKYIDVSIIDGDKYMEIALLNGIKERPSPEWLMAFDGIPYE